VPCGDCAACIAQGGTNAGLRAYCIAQLVGVAAPAKGSGRAGGSAALRVRRFYRPEDTSRDAGYRASFSEVYASEEILNVDVSDVVGRCRVLPAGCAVGEWRAFPPVRACSHALSVCLSSSNPSLSIN
jgi:hypothetical protein